MKWNRGRGISSMGTVVQTAWWKWSETVHKLLQRLYFVCSQHYCLLIFCGVVYFVSHAKGLYMYMKHRVSYRASTGVLEWKGCCSTISKDVLQEREYLVHNILRLLRKFAYQVSMLNATLKLGATFCFELCHWCLICADQR